MPVNISALVLIKSFFAMFLGKPQKSRYFFSGQATKRGGGKGFAIKKKYRFLKH